MADTGAVKFEGQSPFLLPEAKSAQADVVEKSVVVTLYSQVEGHGPGLVSIAVQMPPDVALALATQLTHAGLAARAGGGLHESCRFCARQHQPHSHSAASTTITNNANSLMGESAIGRGGISFQILPTRSCLAAGKGLGGGLSSKARRKQ